MIVYLINLERRPDRLKLALAECSKAGLDPLVWPAVDGATATLLPPWDKSPAGQQRGAYGCSISHRQVLSDFIQRTWVDPTLNALILEDDVVFVDDFQRKLTEVLATVPGDYDALMLGGQHNEAPIPVDTCHGCHPIVRVRHAVRTHAYLVTSAYAPELLSLWEANQGKHIDHVWGEIGQRRARVYAPDPWLAGQSAGQSNILNRHQPERWWGGVGVRPTEFTGVKALAAPRPGGTRHPSVPHNKPRYPTRGGPAPQIVSPAPLKINPVGHTAVVTCATGPTQAGLLALTEGGMRSYARRIGADFHAVTGPITDPRYPVADKWRAYQLLEHYDRMIFLDADVVVSHDAPDLFQIVPADQIAMSEEVRRGAGSKPGWWKPFNAVQRRLGIVPHPPKVYYNTGLIVASKHHLPLLTRQPIHHQNHCDEQHAVNCLVERGGVKVHDLGPELCWLWYFERDKTPEAPFAHYCGCPDRRNKIAGDLAFAPALSKWEKDKLLYLLRRVDEVLEVVLCYGGLLGYVRHGDLLPWDDDLDLLCLDPPDVEVLQAKLPGLRVQRDRNGLLKVFDHNDREEGKPHGFPFLDLCPMTKQDGQLVHKSVNGPPDKWPESVIYPLQRVEIGGTAVNIPANPLQLLVAKYGAQCLSSARPSVWNHRLERATGYGTGRRLLSELLREKEMPRPSVTGEPLERQGVQVAMDRPWNLDRLGGWVCPW